jgi:hypothetical protein
MINYSSSYVVSLSQPTPNQKSNPIGDEFVNRIDALRQHAAQHNGANSNDVDNNESTLAKRPFVMGKLFFHTQLTR